MADIDQLRELVRDFWAGKPLFCARHPGAQLHGTWIETTYADHIHFECEKGGESFAVPQRPKQQEFDPWQTEGLVVFLERNDNVLCYRCQSSLVIENKTAPGNDRQEFLFTCVRCLSWARWEGNPAEASIETPTNTRSA